jgi:hypothetical protein
VGRWEVRRWEGIKVGRYKGEKVGRYKGVKVGSAFAPNELEATAWQCRE